MARLEKVTVSMTETKPFRRLVQFVDEVKQHADEVEDEELKILLNQLADDLLEEYDQ